MKRVLSLGALALVVLVGAACPEERTGTGSAARAGQVAEDAAPAKGQGPSDETMEQLKSLQYVQ